MGPISLISLISPIGAVGPEGPISSEYQCILLRGHYPRTCTKTYFSREYSDVLRSPHELKIRRGAYFFFTPWYSSTVLVVMVVVTLVESSPEV